MSRRGIVIYAFCIALFGVFCYFAHRYDYFPGDVSISQRLQGIPRDWFEPVMRFAPYIVLVLVGLAVLASLRVWLPGRRWVFIRALIFVGLTTLAACLASWLLKWPIDRPRPTPELVEVMVETHGANFPSGHTAMATVAGGFLFYLMPKLVKQRTTAWLLRALLVVLILSVGFSRIYLGAHWLSDIAGGLALGGVLLYPAIVLYKRYEVENA